MESFKMWIVENLQHSWDESVEVIMHEGWGDSKPWTTPFSTLEIKRNVLVASSFTEHKECKSWESNKTFQSWGKAQFQCIKLESKQHIQFKSLNRRYPRGWIVGI